MRKIMKKEKFLVCYQKSEDQPVTLAGFESIKIEIQNKDENFKLNNFY